MKLLQSLIDKYKDIQTVSKNKKELKDLLVQAVQDGKLTTEEIADIEKKKTELGLTDKDIENIKHQLFSLALKATQVDGDLTEKEETELLNIQKYLSISDNEIVNEKKEIDRLRLMSRIKNGDIPPITVVNLVLQKGEIGYWSEPSTLVEEKVINRRYEGGSSGVSFRVMKGVSYRVGSYRGRTITDMGKVVVDDGDLIITSKRLIFRGRNKSFGILLGKLLDIHFFKDGLQVTEANKSKPRMFGFRGSENTEIMTAIMTQSINNYC